MNSQETNRRAKLIDVDIMHNNHKDVLMILQHDTILSKKLRCVEILVSQYISSLQESEIEKEILYELMPCAKELLNSFFENAIELAYDNQQKMCAQTLSAIRECLQMVLSLLDVFEDLLVSVTKANKLPISNIQSAPLYISQIVYSTFLHCKESQNFYKIYFDSISEILQIFKKSQDIHVRLLKLLDAHVVINSLNEEEMLLLKYILEDLVNIGFLLCGMNVKSMADNWKGYTSLTQKYSEGLQTIIDIKGPLEFFTVEILKSLDKLIEMDTSDLKTVTHNLKVTNFLAKVMSKLCVSFFDNLKCHFEIVWEFLIKLYSFPPAFLKKKHVSEEVIGIVNTSLISAFDPLVEKLSMDNQFYQNSTVQNLSSSSYLIVMSALLENLSCNHPKNINDLDFIYIFGSIFSVLQKYVCVLVEKQNVTSDILAYLPVLIVHLNNTTYAQIEQLLCKYLLGNDIWCALFAQEIWLSVIRLSNPKYALDTLCYIANGTKSLLTANYTPRMEQIIVATFIKNIFVLLPAESMQKFVAQYPIRQNLFVWGWIGLENLPKSAAQHIEQCMTDTVAAMEQFESGKCTQQDFAEMIDLIRVTATIAFEEIYFDLNKLTTVLLALWNLESVDNLVEYQFFDKLLEALFALVNALLWRIDASQFLQITEVIKILLKSSNITKILTLDLLGNTNIEKLCSNYQAKESLCSNISEILMCLLTEDVTIRMKTFEILSMYSNNSVTREIVKNTLRELPGIKTEYTKFSKGSFSNSSEDTLSIYEKLQSTEFVHECVPVKELEQTKKFKFDESTAFSAGINKLKEDVSNLKELIKNNGITNQQAAEISTVIGELYSYIR